MGTMSTLSPEQLTALAHTLKHLNRVIAGLETEIERLIKAREMADEDSTNTARELRRTLTRLNGMVQSQTRRQTELEQAMDDAMRALELDDKQGAMGVLRGVLSK